MQPLVSCLCPTFNRYTTGHIHLLEEAIKCFQMQAYPNKELIVCNDAPGQILRLIQDDPQIRIVNTATRFPNLSAKLNYMIAIAQGELICRWDDDDIHLPWRLDKSVSSLLSLADTFSQWCATNHWYTPANRIEGETRHAGNRHVHSIWNRRLLTYLPNKRYPQGCGNEDQLFMSMTQIATYEERLPKRDIFYLYRWSVAQHLSGVADYSNKAAPHQVQWDALGKQECFAGDVRLNPRWRKDYIRMASEAADLNAG